jgi:hypothetical protein
LSGGDGKDPAVGAEPRQRADSGNGREPCRGYEGITLAEQWQLPRCGDESTTLRGNEDAAFSAGGWRYALIPIGLILRRTRHTHRLVEDSPDSTKESVMEDQDQPAEATKAVKAKIRFYIHLVVYALVNAGLIAINLSTSTEHLWFKWPLLGWGIGVCFHALAVFVFRKGGSIRERMIAKEMQKKTLEKP